MTNKKYAVHTPTQKSYDRLMEAYGKKGWPNRSDYWHFYKIKTCIVFQDMFSYSPRDFFEKEGYKIITVSQAIKKLSPKPICKENGCKNQAWSKNHCKRHQVVDGGFQNVLLGPEAGEGTFVKSPLLKVGDTSKVKVFTLEELLVSYKINTITLEEILLFIKLK